MSMTCSSLASELAPAGPRCSLTYDKRYCDADPKWHGGARFPEIAAVDQPIQRNLDDMAAAAD
eukprot:4873659-Prorocentrum_lima.AAC.1